MSDGYVILGLVAGLGAVAIALLHYLPWEMILGKTLCPPWTYVIGVGWIAACLLGWLLLVNAPLFYIVGALSIIISIGVGDLSAYALRAIARDARRERIDGQKADGAPRD